MIDELISRYPDLQPWTTGKGERAAFVPFHHGISEGQVTHAYASPYVGRDTCIITKTGDGKWVLPGGTVEAGETWQEALEREILEETGCRILRYQPFGAYRVIGNRTTFRIVCWADVEQIAQPNDPDGELGITEIRLIRYADAVIYYTATRAHFGAVYLLSHEIREQCRETDFITNSCC